MERPHIVISYEEHIPNEVFDNFLSILKDEKLNMIIEARQPSGLMATYEWIIPTAVIAYIGKSYFDSFLKEMGKDHYNLLKKGLSSLIKKLFGEETPQVTIISTPGKVNGSNKYSRIFSVLAESDDGFNFKLLIQSDVSKEECDKIISSFITLLDDYHSESIDNNIKKNITNIGMFGRTVLCAYDFEKSKLEFLDPRSNRETDKA